jgi:hypothetical protein
MSKDVNLNLNLKNLPQQLAGVGRTLQHYRIVLFVVFVVLVYGFVVLRINTLDNVQPSADSVSAQSDPIRTTNINPQVVKQLESLKNNHVNVQTLFDQARNNPFQED